MTAPDHKEVPKTCGMTELLIFIAAIVSGTACSICSKTMMDLHGIGITGEVESFSKPLFQTFGMFVGMLFGLLMHWAVVFFRIPFPGYDHPSKVTNVTTNTRANETTALLDGNNQSNTITATATPTPTLPVWMYFFLAIPSIFDLGATALCMMGLRYLDVSVYQLLRGSGIIFVAIMKHNLLGNHLYHFQWLGVLYNVLSVILVGLTAIFSEESLNKGTYDSSHALWGILFVLTGAFVQALQYVLEEKVMTMDVPSPPLLLIGMEGLWGTVLSILVVFPIAYILPGDDHGSYEDPFNTWHMIINTPSIQYMFVVYFVAIFSYNLFAVLVTFMLNSIWHAILDNFRPITVWLVDMVIYYFLSTAFGEPWTKWSYLQLVGMAVLLFGTAIYNAPNAGSVKLTGDWWALGFDFTQEYANIDADTEEQALHAAWEERQQSFKQRTHSSFVGERSPFLTKAQHHPVVMMNSPAMRSPRVFAPQNIRGKDMV
jgi:drug/metabolite transporter (DMT)-like permease